MYCINWILIPYSGQVKRPIILLLPMIRTLDCSLKEDLLKFLFTYKPGSSQAWLFSFQIQFCDIYNRLFRSSRSKIIWLEHTGWNVNRLTALMLFILQSNFAPWFHTITCRFQQRRRAISISPTSECFHWNFSSACVAKPWKPTNFPQLWTLIQTRLATQKGLIECYVP